jgi:uncharacterized protein DUF397
METPDLSRAQWRTSTYSGSNGNCVEVAVVAPVIVVRDSADPDGPALHFTQAQWATFTGTVQAPRC